LGGGEGEQQVDVKFVIATEVFSLSRDVCREETRVTKWREEICGNLKELWSGVEITGSW